MTKLHKKLVEFRRKARGTEYHSHIVWLMRLHEQQIVKDYLTAT